MTAPENTLRQFQYVEAVISLYLQLPDTPDIPSSNDRFTAAGFFAQGFHINIIEASLLLASLRRLSRDIDLPPLSPVRSLAYFTPVVKELSASSITDEYLNYLRLKLQKSCCA